MGKITFDEFQAAFEVALARSMEKKPDDYMLLDARLVTERMVAAIKAKSVRGVNINSATFRHLAKRWGIKNTYKAWQEFLPQRESVT